MPLQTRPYTYAGGQAVSLLVTDRNQIPYIEYLDYGESWKPDGIESSRVVGCLFKDRYAFVGDILGTSLYQPGNVVGGVTSNMTRYVPESHPEYTASDGASQWMFASEMDLIATVGLPVADMSDLAKALSSSVDYSTVQPTGDSNMVAFNLAKFKITYRPVNYFVYKDADTPSTPGGELGRFVIRNTTYGAQNLGVAGALFAWVPAGPGEAPPPGVLDTLFEPPPKTVGTMTLLYTWLGVPDTGIANANIAGAIGTVNSTQFDGYWPAGTLLCLPPERKPYRSAVGDPVVDYTFQYLYLPNLVQTGTQAGTFGGHNYVLRAASRAGKMNDFRELSLDGNPHPASDATGQHIYPGSDFNQMFIIPGN